MFTSSANPAQGDDESSVQADLAASHVTAAPVFTVAELVTNHLHELATVGARTSKTIDSYRSFANKWVTPLIGALAVSSVRADDIDAVLDAMARAGRSASSIGHVRTLLRASFAQAHAAGVIASSPMESNESVHRPKRGTYADERARADE